MVGLGERKQDERGLSARYLILVFLVGVAACAVFFSLGFLVGYNERTSRSAGPTEQVTPSGAIPPTVNAPLETVQTTGNETAPINPQGTAPQPSLTESAAEQEPAGGAAPPPAPSLPSRRTSARAATHSVPARRARGREVGAGYTVQVAASRNKQDAEKLVKELKSRGFAVFVVRPEHSEVKDNLYRVQVGPFATHEEAQRVRNRIAKEGFKPFVKH